jgi:hypothetical protein
MLHLVCMNLWLRLIEFSSGHHFLCHAFCVVCEFMGLESVGVMVVCQLLILVGFAALGCLLCFTLKY